jgi:hypothetical protein
MFNKLCLLLLVFTCNSAWAMGGSRYLPPSNVEFSKLSINLGVNCDSANPQISASVSGISQVWIEPASGSPHENLGSPDHDLISLLQGKLTKNNTDSASKLQLQGTIIQLRADSKSEWISVGTFSMVDVQNYCKAYNDWRNSPPPRSDDIPSSVLPITLNSGVTVSISRSDEHSFCFSNIEDGSAERTLDYYVQITDTAGHSEEFSTQDDLVFGSSDQCKSWTEAPWLKK